MYGDDYRNKKGVISEGRKKIHQGLFLFGIWFESKRLSADTMDIGYDNIGIVKTNTKGLCRDKINNLTKY